MRPILHGVRSLIFYSSRLHAASYAGRMLQAAAGEAAARELVYVHMKSEQLRVVEAFVQGRDVFAILPTGYGKNLCYGCSHLCLTTSIVVAVMAITAIMVMSLHSCSTNRDQA